MSDDEPKTVETAASCFRTLIAFADERGDHLLAALLVDAQERFAARHRWDVEGADDA